MLDGPSAAPQRELLKFFRSVHGRAEGGCLVGGRPLHVATAHGAMEAVCGGLADF